MNKEELEQCGCWFDDTGKCITDDIDLNEFTKLVAEREREECAKVCDVLAVHPEYASSITKLAAQAIRNRRQL